MEDVTSFLRLEAVQHPVRLSIVSPSSAGTPLAVWCTNCIMAVPRLSVRGSLAELRKFQDHFHKY